MRLRPRPALVPLVFLAACAHVAPWEGPPPLGAGERVRLGTPDAAKLKLRPLVVDVLLQVHAEPLAAGQSVSGEAGAARRDACQRALVSTVLDRARHGARDVVVEGVVGLGEPLDPVAVGEGPTGLLPTGMVVMQHDGFDATRYLADRPEVRLFGFEPQRTANEGLDAMERALGDLRPGADLTPVVRELAIVALDDEARSFHALETAVAVAVARHDDEVQLVIGAGHWGDLRNAYERLPPRLVNVAAPLVLVRYACDTGDDELPIEAPESRRRRPRAR